ncbi:hypothetical protein B0H17DRAFT_1336160 [Mycena rosella]|uniref:Myb-like domain-containing protein n=1 Tax=Mycena rosella TaxID=1033263 RepID=A0AAD7CWE3_MYCRO|nr:hypothetical protein B0H17DRAFT_1336160 [Mycena rosella]
MRPRPAPVAPPPAKPRRKRPRQEFTESEDEHFIESLAAYEPEDRGTIFTFRAIAAKSWGAKHTATSWLKRYMRYRDYWDNECSDALAHKKTKARKRRTASHRRNAEESEAGPAAKKRRLTPERTGDSGPFGELHIPYDRFMQKAHPVTDADQFIAMNLAVNHLGAVHGLEPELVYAAWELAGDLKLTDKRLQQVGDDEDEQDGNDENAHDLQFTDERLRLQQVGDDEDEQDENDDSNAHDEEVADLLMSDPRGPSSLTPNPTEEPSARNTAPKPKPTTSPLNSSTHPIPVPPPRRVYGRARKPDTDMAVDMDMDVVPSSIPDEVGIAPSLQPRRQRPPAMEREGTVIPDSDESDGEVGSDREHAAPRTQRAGSGGSSTRRGRRALRPRPKIPSESLQHAPAVHAEDSDSDSDPTSDHDAPPPNTVTPQRAGPGDGDSSDSSESESQTAASAPKTTAARGVADAQPAVNADDSASDDDSDSESGASAARALPSNTQHPANLESSESESESDSEESVRPQANTQEKGEDSSESESAARPRQASPPEPKPVAPTKPKLGDFFTQGPSEDSESESQAHGTQAGRLEAFAFVFLSIGLGRYFTERRRSARSNRAVHPHPKLTLRSYQLAEKPLVTRFVSADKKGARIPKNTEMHNFF